jgi:hypothetical protein
MRMVVLATVFVIGAAIGWLLARRREPEPMLDQSYVRRNAFNNAVISGWWP